MRAPIGNFAEAVPVTERLELLAEPVAAALRGWQGAVPAGDLLHVDSDPEVADTAVFCETYGRDLLDKSANCVVVAGKRGGEVTLAACVVLSTSRVDVNNAVRRHLDVRKASFARTELATAETGMEYGGITPIGLPEGWPLLIDPRAADAPHLIIGSGRRRGKLIVPGKALAGLPGAVVLEGLGI